MSSFMDLRLYYPQFAIDDLYPSEAHLAPTRGIHCTAGSEKFSSSAAPSSALDTPL